MTILSIEINNLANQANYTYTAQLLKKEILIHLIYGEIFQHPLTLEELQTKIGTDQLVERSLNELVQAGLIGQSDIYYFVFEDRGKVDKRIQGSKSACKLLPKAIKRAQFIAKFPYVEGVGISGSLSKGVLYEDSDFDFFIITKPQRLWIARTLLIFYKKLFLFNSRKYFCVNYFIDSEHLEIEEKNLFTAVEISTLIHVVGNPLQNFSKNNQWIKEFIHYPQKTIIKQQVTKKPIISRMITTMCNGRFGEWLDDYFMRLTIRKWKKKFGDFEGPTFDLTLKSRTYISKHHPQNFQEKVLKTYDELLLKYKQQFDNQIQAQSIEL